MQRSRHFAKAMFIVLVGALAFASVAGAQTSLQGRGEVSVGGGASFPFGDFKDLAETGYLVTPRLGYYIAPTVALGAEYGYFKHGADQALIDLLESLAGRNVEAEFQLHQVTGYVKILLTPKPIAPYLRLHAGLYHLDATIEVQDLGSDTTTEDKFGFGGGLGIQFRGDGSVGGFVDAIYHAILMEDSTRGLLGVQAGVIFFIGNGS